MRILRAADRRPQPWKNGGGQTSAVIVHPAEAGMEDFAWRISIAQVDHAGDFSRFAGIDRVLAVLDGVLELDCRGQISRLDQTSEPMAFPGEAPVSGRPLGASVRDLNLMVRRGDWSGRMRRSAAGRLATLAQTSILLVETSARIEVDGVDADLAPLDALVLDRGHALAVPCPFLMIEISPLQGMGQADARGDSADGNAAIRLR